MTYNALDIKQKAEAIREQLILELADLEQTISYEHHLNLCDAPKDDCGYPIVYDDDYYAPTITEQYAERVQKAIAALSAYLESSPAPV